MAKRELAWEVDYNREAEFTTNFGEMIAQYPDFRVPKVFTELSTNRILATELVPGVPMDQCFNYRFVLYIFNELFLHDKYI